MAKRILVVGAGPTGLTVAVELARRGIVPEIVERRREPSGLSRAVGILPSSMDIFARSGTDAPIRDEAIRFSGIRFHRMAEPVAEFPLNFDERTRIWGLAQDRTESHLTESLMRLGGGIRFGAAFEHFEQHGDGVDATVDGDTRRYDLLIGADGVSSTVRTVAGIAFEGFDLPSTWSIADVDAPGWEGGTQFMGYLLRQGNVAVVVPLEERRYRVIASTDDALAALPVPMPVSRVRREGTFTIPIRQASVYQSGRVFLAGDAAHAHSPVGGRGMNLGISDAADLAERIATGTTETYHAARHPAGAHVLKFSERGRRNLQSENAMRRGLAIAAMRVAGSAPSLRRAAARWFVNG